RTIEERRDDVHRTASFHQREFRGGTSRSANHFSQAAGVFCISACVRIVRRGFGNASATRQSRLRRVPLSRRDGDLLPPDDWRRTVSARRHAPANRRRLACDADYNGGWRSPLVDESHVVVSAAAPKKI